LGPVGDTGHAGGRGRARLAPRARRRREIVGSAFTRITCGVPPGRGDDAGAVLSLSTHGMGECIATDQRRLGLSAARKKSAGPKAGADLVRPRSGKIRFANDQ